MANEIIPFGKYKGQTVEVIAETDAKYLEWLQLQPFLVAKFPKLLQAISALATGEGAETPEHNALQALFLDDVFCEAFGRLVEEGNPPIAFERIDREMEAKNGSDVRLELRFSKQPPYDFWLENTEYNKRWNRPVVPYEEAIESVEREYFIEIKPLLGDDYPAVLRQMRQQESRSSVNKSYQFYGGVAKRVGALAVEEFSSAAISFEQLKKIFHPYRVVMIQAVKDEVNRLSEGRP